MLNKGLVRARMFQFVGSEAIAVHKSLLRHRKKELKFEYITNFAFNIYEIYGAVFNLYVLHNLAVLVCIGYDDEV